MKKEQDVGIQGSSSKQEQLDVECIIVQEASCLNGSFLKGPLKTEDLGIAVPCFRFSFARQHTDQIRFQGRNLWQQVLALQLAASRASKVCTKRPTTTWRAVFVSGYWKECRKWLILLAVGTVKPLEPRAVFSHPD